MSKFAVKLKLPAKLVDFTASYSQVKKMNGIQFMVLTIASTNSFRKMTWEEVMNRLGIPDIIFYEMFEPTLELMANLGIIEQTDAIDYEDEVSEIALTKVGVETFRNGVIAQKIESFEGTVAYVPAYPNNKYVKASMINYCNKNGFNEKTFSDLTPDEQMIENHIVKEKEKYGVDEKDAEVFNIDMTPQEELQCYESNIQLTLDEVSGHFIIDDSNLDENFLKSMFTSKEILSLMPEALLKLSDTDVQINTCSVGLPEWSSMMFYLPFDLKLNKAKIVLINASKCNSSKYPSSTHLGIADFVSIDTSNLGYEYAWIRFPTTVEGLEGEYDVKLIVRHSLSPERIKEYISSAARDLKPTKSDTLAKALSYANIINDKDLSDELIFNCLRDSKNLVSLLIELQQYKKEKWYQNIPDILEKVLLNKDCNAATTAIILNQAEIEVSGTLLVTKFRSENNKLCLENADALVPVVRNEILFLRNMGLEQTIADVILSGNYSTYNSKYLAAMSNLSKNLHALREIFKIKSLSDYHFDLSIIDEETKNRVKTYLATYAGDMDIVRPLIKGTEQYSELKAYESFFKEIHQFINNNDSSNRRNYAIVEAIRLADALKRYGFDGDLDTMLSEAHSEGLISDGDFELLTDFRQFRNECAHNMVVREVNSKEFKKWKQAIDNISHINNKEETRT